MTFSIASVNRTRRLSMILVSYLTFVVLIALILPILSLLQYEHKIHIDWLIDNGRSMLPWASLVAFSFVIFYRTLHRFCTRVAAWVFEDSDSRGRWTVIALCLLIVTSYSWQLNIGIAHRGVPGWAYVGIPAFIQNDAPPSLSLPPEIARSVFDSALQPWVMPYIHKSGFASSEVLFLHFKDGTMRPANYQLAMVSWPKSTFKLEDGKLSHGQAFLAIVKYYFAQRRAGHAFLLPSAISYPNHINYQQIDYRDYPPANEITGLSIWMLTAQVDAEQKKLNVVGAKKLTQVNE